MADSAYGLREVELDLTVAGARVIKDATLLQVAMIRSIRIKGTAGAGTGDIVLRKESASGPVIFRQIAPNGSAHDGTLYTAGGGQGKLCGLGLYMDALSTAWTAGSILAIYFD